MYRYEDMISIWYFYFVAFLLVSGVTVFNEGLIFKLKHFGGMPH